MKKWLAGVLLGISLMGSGCVTCLAADGIERSGFSRSQKTLAEVATVPVTGAMDIALSPIEIPFFFLILAALGGHGC
jgi:hypothetical protein